MATFPPRINGLERRIKELAPQCDLMRIYMNGYKKWPKHIPLPSNVEYILAPGKLDKGSQGKLHWLDGEPGYYMTVDDDICYPSDYVKAHVKANDRYHNKFITAFHGQRFRIQDLHPAPLKKEASGVRKMFQYCGFLAFDTAVHMVGNGLMCCVPSTLGLSSDAVRGPKDSGDDEDIALFAQRTKTTMVVIKHMSEWIKPDNEIWPIEASFRNKKFTQLQNEKLQTCRRWVLNPIK